MGAGVEPPEGQGARVHRWPVRGRMGERPRGRANPRLRDAPEPRRRVRPPPSRALTLRPAWVRAPCARPRPGSPLASCAFPARPRRAGLSSVPASSGSMQAAAASRAPLCGRLGPLQCAAKDTGPRAHSCPGVPGACRSRTASPRSGMGRVLSHPRRGRTRGRCPASRVPSEPRPRQHVVASRSQTPASLAGCHGVSLSVSLALSHHQGFVRTANDS